MAACIWHGCLIFRAACRMAILRKRLMPTRWLPSMTGSARPFVWAAWCRCRAAGGGVLKRPDVLSHSQPQSQLTISACAAINEVLQRWRHAAPFKAEATQDFLRDGV